jgi:hypothetical protein
MQLGAESVGAFGMILKACGNDSVVCQRHDMMHTNKNRKEIHTCLLTGVAAIVGKGLVKQRQEACVIADGQGALLVEHGNEASLGVVDHVAYFGVVKVSAERCTRANETEISLSELLFSA